MQKHEKRLQKAETLPLGLLPALASAKKVDLAGLKTLTET